MALTGEMFRLYHPVPDIS